MTPDDAGAKWAADLQDPQIKRVNTNGVIKLAVQGHESFVHERGVDKRQRVQRQVAEVDTTEGQNLLVKRAKQFHSADDDAFASVGGAMFRPGAAATATTPALRRRGTFVRDGGEHFHGGAGGMREELDDAPGEESDGINPKDSVSQVGVAGVRSSGDGVQTPGGRLVLARAKSTASARSVVSSAAPSTIVRQPPGKARVALEAADEGADAGNIPTQQPRIRSAKASEPYIWVGLGS